MKSIHGLAVAIALGIAGTILNLAYLNSRSKSEKPINFLGIKQGTINVGKAFSQDDFEVVSIPEGLVGNLDEYAVLQSAANAVIGQRSWRTLSGPRLLLNDDLKAPPSELELGEDEASIGVPVDSRAYPLTLVVPGDRVSFLVSAYQLGGPTPAVRNDVDDLGDPVGLNEIGPVGPIEPTETIGPFEVLSLGNRLGTLEVMKANRIAQMQGNVMTIRVKVRDNKLVDEDAKRLVEVLLATKFREVGILHFPKKRKP